MRWPRRRSPTTSASRSTRSRRRWRRGAGPATAWRWSRPAAGATVIDDTYNASPVSVGAALDFLGESPLAPGRARYAVLGDMLELGPDEERLHREVGALRGRPSPTRWWRSASAAAGSPRGRGRRACAASARRATPDEAVLAVERDLAPGVGDLLLVKGSRGIELDRLVAALTGQPAGHD